MNRLFSALGGIVFLFAAGAIILGCGQQGTTPESSATGTDASAVAGLPSLTLAVSGMT